MDAYNLITILAKALEEGRIKKDSKIFFKNGNPLDSFSFSKIETIDIDSELDVILD